MSRPHLTTVVLGATGALLAGAPRPAPAPVAPVPLASSAVPAPALSPALVFTGVTVIDVATGARHPAQTVVIVGTRIQAVGAAGKVAMPAGARVVDATGRYLIPGLWDMHAHVGPPPEKFYPSFIAYGVTGIRELAQQFPGGTDSFRVWNRQIVAGTRVGPRGVGPSYDMCYGNDENFEIQPQPTAAFLDSLKAAGIAFLKVHSCTTSRDTFFAIARAARRAGLPFVGHLPANRGGEFWNDRWWQWPVTEIEASDSGLQSMEHIPLPTCWPTITAPPDTLLAQRCAPVAAAFARNGTWFVPTLSMYTQMGYGRQDAQEVVRVMHQYGAPILAGTDVGPNFELNGQVIGRELHDELALLAGAMTPLEALRTATLNPAQFFHATDSLGTVAPGKLADLVLLDADPLVDIRNTETIRAVVANGRYFDSTALAALRAAAPPTRPREPVEEALYFGYRRAQVQAFQSPEQLQHDTLLTYSTPVLATLGPNTWALAGSWRVSSEQATLPVAPGRLVLRFRSRYLIIQASGDLRDPQSRPELAIGARHSVPPRLRFRVRLDGQAPGKEHGMKVDENGVGEVTFGGGIGLVLQQGPLRERTVEVEFLDPVAIYKAVFDASQH